MPFVTVDGQEIFYTFSEQDLNEDEATSRPPLVLIHGAGGTHLHWPPRLRRLPGVAVYAVDLPGHGNSAGAGRQSIAAYRAVVQALVEAWRLPPFVLAGHSMGSAIALDFALTCPTVLAGLGLVGAGARLRVGAAILDGIHADFDATTALITDWMYAPGLDRKKRSNFIRRLRAIGPDVLYDDYAACHVFDVRAQVASIQLPTLIICGREDRMTPVKYSEFLHENIANSELHIVDNAGHMVLLEQPDVVTSLFGVFLGKLSRLRAGG